VCVGIEATGHSRWFERLLAELNFELWIGDPAQIRAKQVRKQRNDRRDAEHILKLMRKDDFPRLWVPTPENRDVTGYSVTCDFAPAVMRPPLPTAWGSTLNMVFWLESGQGVFLRFLRLAIFPNYF